MYKCLDVLSVAQARLVLLYADLFLAMHNLCVYRKSGQLPGWRQLDGACTHGALEGGGVKINYSARD